jgi:hypothetical protein
MATLYLSRISSASISALGYNRDRHCSCGHTSGFPWSMAEETTTTSAPAICFPVADVDGAPQPRQVGGDIRCLHIRTGDLVSQVQQQFGDAAHANTADTDEVDMVFL